MKNNFETQEKINELMPNEACIPCDTNSSELLRKEHNRWKADVKERQEDQSAITSYWRSASSCIAL